MIKKYLSWINTNLLFILSTFLIAFIPLFPKIPLFDILPGYIVRIRAEDFLIFITAIIWLRDAYQKKFSWNSSYIWFVLVYAAIGLISILLGTILLQSIPTQLLHIGKSALHFFRYMEYFALFFFLYSSVKTKQHIKIILVTIVITLAGIIAYGFGQQYWHFPLYSTMNREYSKGQKLYLQENARPQSTFAGHYDLGAYLVIILPIIFALSIGDWNSDKKSGSLKKIKKLNFKKYWPKILHSKQTYFKLTLHILHLSGAWMLVTSGSKTALAAYLVGIFIVISFYLKKLKNFKQQLKWGGIALVTITIVLTTALTIFGQETKSMLISIAQQNLIANKIISKIPGLSTEEIDQNDFRPTDLYGEGHEYRTEITTSEDGITTKTIVAQESTWSENALKYGISMGIRLDTLWPQAVKGLINNPLFGNGYATLTSITDGQFTEADSTDNNFLRTLGETGILGFVSFYGLIIFILKNIWKNTRNKDPLIATLNIGLAGSIIGLLINASYIDVFAASKVAFTFWALLGLGTKSSNLILNKPDLKAIKILNHFKKHSSFYIALLVLFFLLHKNPYKDGSIIRNFETSNHAIENVVSAKCFINNGSFSVCSNNGLVLKDNLNLYSIFLVPFLKINSDPATFYFLNLTIAITIFIIIYKLLLKITKDHPASNNKFSTVLISLLTTDFLLYSVNIFGTAPSITSSPLISKNILIIFIVIPIVVISLAKLLLSQKKKLIFITRLALISSLVFIGTLLPTNIFDEIKTNFRNDKDTYKNWTVERSNIFFNDKLLTDETKDKYLITTLNPYFFDLYKNKNYKTLPMSEAQTYFDNAQNVWSDLKLTSNKINLKETYKNILDNKKPLYITDYGTHQSSESKYKIDFDKIKSEFDLEYDAIDCNEQCNFYSVKTVSPIISGVPESINNIGFDLKRLSNKYTFSIFSSRFNPNGGSLKNTRLLTTNLNLAGFNQNLSTSNQEDFLIFMGDPIYRTDKSWGYYFNQNFSQYNRYPILYGRTNHHKFFSEHDYYLFLNPDENSQVDIKQKIFIYNAFLELEKLPEIKNIFIIAHNLDWQSSKGAENQENFLISLKKKLSDFPNLNKYIITNNHNLDKKNQLTNQYKFDEQTKTHYFSYTESIPGYGVRYIQFTVKENSEVSFEEISFNPKVRP
jgi:hypothetical protein